MTNLDSTQWKRRIALTSDTYTASVKALDFLNQAQYLTDGIEITLNGISAGIQITDASGIGELLDTSCQARALAREATASLDALTEKLAVLRRDMQAR